MVGPTDTSHFSFSYSNFSWLHCILVFVVVVSIVEATF